MSRKSRSGWLLALVGIAALAGPRSCVLRAFRRRGRLGRFADLVRPFAYATRVLVGWRCTAGRGHPRRVDARGVDLLAPRRLAPAWDHPGRSFVPRGAHELVSIIPSAPGYVGTFEAAVVFGLHAIGIEGGQAVAYALLIRFLLYVPITAVGLVLLLVRYGGLPRLIPGRFRGAES